MYEYIITTWREIYSTLPKNKQTTFILNYGFINLISDNETEAKENQLSDLTACGLNFTGLFITVRDGDSSGVQCVPVTLLPRLAGAKMCLQH